MLNPLSETTFEAHIANYLAIATYTISAVVHSLTSNACAMPRC